MRPEPEFTPEADADVLEAASHYNARRAGLGHDFLDELERAVLRIRENPIQFPVVDDPLRRVLLRRFPYGVFYVVGPLRETVTAVVDLRRHPDKWKLRVPR